MIEALSLVLALVAAPPPESVASASASQALCPDETEVRGLYRNYSYGFTLTIPAPLHGLWNSAACVFDSKRGECVCMSDHGRSIPLGGDALITIYAEYASDDLSLPTRLYQDLDSFRGGAGVQALSVTSLGSYLLGGLTALRYSASLHRGGSVRLREAVFAESPDGHIAFMVILDGPEATVQANRAAFEAILKTWHVTPRE